ncbi:NAD(P)H-dependent oxidoreductase [Colwellia sp. MB02u-18]|uniref:flavodoxin family protein n=1 Tax=unclassified Colwellia TaxID=196834 RepID=UPI0015F4CEA2|nr:MULTISPECIES: NAD(P)H-dependent oxidoreductase [unclassified Colwellia]MBA6223635.1 NAD(P)H-dependent oxidoreductase [Colwellia sp. MB3u-45]MBA6267299.1 NAD(P)H-dependent oxidoreductase [Colwellia sp. MB3u-43]MBA6319816.1 NAD(P)H-dependent oxidoreductase [Colwellia sp. MB02u-19]MBA6323805.1 NAD(P)H-dependent oxidoreductase [Colwellia sp. MB02u-18]MBA6330795.1 NAD(P)H-dependent oxidoreductase [Colwellia sp. MB02u-12]
MNKTIALIGSSRRDGNTGKLIDLIAGQLRIEVLDLALKNISPFDYNHKNCGDDFLPLMDRLLKYENIVFASPVYWFAMSAQMKIFIDRMSDLLSVQALKDQRCALKSKVGYIVSTSGSEVIDHSFMNSFTDTFEYLGIHYGGFVHLDCKNGFDVLVAEKAVKHFVNKLNQTV